MDVSHLQSKDIQMSLKRSLSLIHSYYFRTSSAQYGTSIVVVPRQFPHLNRVRSPKPFPGSVLILIASLFRKSLLQPAAVNQAFGTDMLYWTREIDEDLMKKMLNNSMCFGLYELPSSSSDIAGISPCC
jgi:hypothetical protein